jgi:hypothetical protein
VDQASRRVIYWGWLLFCVLAFVFWPAGPEQALGSFVVFFFIWLFGQIGWWWKLH